MDAILESVRQITYACIEYIEENAVWLGIVGVAVLILLVLFGSLAAAGRSRKQTRALRRIDRKMETLLAAQEQGDAGRADLAEDVAAIRASLESSPERMAAAHRETVEQFFADTEIEECAVVLQEETAAAAEDPDLESAEEVQAAESAETVPETEPVEEAQEVSSDAQEATLPEAAADPAEPEEDPAFPALQEVLLNGAAARGKSGRLYTREELENQIRK